MVNKYLIAANTPRGFYSYFQDILKGCKVICIKGGSGIGKSTFLKRIALEANSRGFDVLYMPCSSDYDSLDAIKILGLDVVVVDATAPHVIEPPLYGVCGDMINLGAYLDIDKLKVYNNTVKELNDVKSLMYTCMYNHIAGAKGNMDNIDSIYAAHCNFNKLEEISHEFISDFLSQPKPSKIALKAFSGYISENGYTSVTESLKGDRKVIRLVSRSGNIARHVLMRVAQYLDGLGVRCEKYFALLYPESVENIGLGDYFITTSRMESDSEIDLDITVDSIGFNRFIPMIIDERGAYISNITRSGEYFKNARKCHSELEECYSRVMDFSGAEKEKSKIIDRIFNGSI